MILYYEEEDVRFMPKQPDDNSLSGEPPHDCMEPKLQEEIDRLNMSKKEVKFRNEIANKDYVSPI